MKKNFTTFETLIWNLICVGTLGNAYFIKLLIKKAIVDASGK